MSDLHDRRQHTRIAGPFDGLRIGIIETPIRICNLSEGGCFIDSMNDAPAPGTVLDLRIDLPVEGWISVRGRALYPRPGYGFALEFTDMSRQDRALLAAALAGVRQPAPR
jgi:hypothetical protein